MILQIKMILKIEIELIKNKIYFFNIHKKKRKKEYHIKPEWNVIIRLESKTEMN